MGEGTRPAQPARPEGMSSTEFGLVARAVAAEARRQGLQVPGFRSPPRVTAAVRTVRRLRSGGAMVSVRLRGRPEASVVEDLVAGVLHVNGLRGPAAERARSRLLAAAGATRAAA